MLLLCLSALSPAASVFVGGGVVLKMAGTGAALAFIAGGVIAFLLALLIAELGTAFPRAGGAYPGLAATLGPWAGFLTLVISLAINPAVLGLASLGLADYVSALVPGLPRLALVSGGLLLATLLGLLNIRANAIITGTFLVLELLALGILAGVALLHPVRSLSSVILHPAMASGDGGMQPLTQALAGIGIVAAAFVCAGASYAVFFGEELQDAKRRLGGVIIGAAAMGSVMIAAPIVLLVLAASDLPGILGSEAPVAAFLHGAAGPSIGAVVTGGVALAIFNNMIALALANSRLLYSTGRDYIWPRAVNRMLLLTHPRFKSPWAATLAANAIAAGFCALGERGILVFVSGEVVTGLLIALAVVAGRRKSLTGVDGLYRSPLFPAIPILAIAFAGATITANAMDADAGRPSMILLTLLDAAALIYYAAILRRRPGGWQTQAPADEAAL